jgi:hypothetical protein
MKSFFLRRGEFMGVPHSTLLILPVLGEVHGDLDNFDDKISNKILMF